jgi:D-alanyl-D-alanine carboxypeptidase/D-alanyl-D-alanine carboxypeptidase (penicillin-binding protein 5/6)
MASTTKIMSALIALESGDIDEEFTVDSEAIKVEGSSMGLCEGDTVTMRTLVCGMLLPSGNDAANAAAVRISGSVEEFVNLMNERAADMGLENTHFVTPSGLDDDTDEHFSTAYDMARLAAAAMENDDFASICSQKYIKVTFGNPPYERWLTNSNKLLDSCEGTVGVKTGFTDKAGRCLISACERNGARLVCVTLSDPNDWADHAALYDYSFKKMKSFTFPTENLKYETAVVGSDVKSVFGSCEAQNLTLPEGAEDKITQKVLLKPFVYAPVKKGDVLGCVRIFYNEKLMCEIPIVCESEANLKKTEKAGLWQKIKALRI